MEGAQCFLLISTTTADSAQEIGQRRLEDMLKAKKIVFTTIDGSLPEFKEQRDEMFTVSSLRGKYPQVFLKSSSGTLNYIGNWDKIQELCECDDLPKEILDSNPTIETFTKAFACANKEQ